MVPPSPCVLRRLGDPQVALETRFVFRLPLRLFPFLMGWFRRKFRRIRSISSCGVEHQASVLFPPESQ
jgi:hypothetical protein